MFKTSFRFLIAIAALGFVSCSTHVDLPKGTSKGYTSARLVQRDPNRPAPTNATEVKVNRMIQQSLAGKFATHGLAFGKSDADLVIAYLVIFQEPGVTTRYDDYFGYGRSADEIGDVAHTRGILKSKRPDYFERAGIVIDVIDSRTNKLVYRNYAVGDVVRGATDSVRTSRIDAAVAEAIGPFFGKK
jgi:hypothetical protein